MSLFKDLNVKIIYFLSPHIFVFKRASKTIYQGFDGRFFEKFYSNCQTQENQYASTSVWFAGFLSVVPPLAGAYLQRKINFHWHAHVKQFLSSLQ
jgi:hypothetical protein